MWDSHAFPLFYLRMSRRRLELISVSFQIRTRVAVFPTLRRARSHKEPIQRPRHKCPFSADATSPGHSKETVETVWQLADVRGSGMCGQEKRGTKHNSEMKWSRSLDSTTKLRSDLLRATQGSVLVCRLITFTYGYMCTHRHTHGAGRVNTLVCNYSTNHLLNLSSSIAPWLMELVARAQRFPSH